MITTLQIEKVHPSEKNTRVDYNGADMAELVESIKKVGLLNAIIVRPAGEGYDGYEIVAGHRRFHAIKKLKWTEIPVSVIPLTDENAALAQLTENLHRKDLNPIEEARAFKQMKDAAETSDTVIAALASKSRGYVIRSLALLDLPKVAIKAIESGELPAAHGHQLARAPEKEREKLAKYATSRGEWSKQLPTLADLKHEIAKKIEKELKVAPFPKDVEKYGGTETPACTACPYNTGNQEVLFDGAPAGKCTNPGCYNKRSAFAYKEMAAKVQADMPNLKFLGTASYPGYMEFRDIKGFPIVSDKNFKKARENPEKYGFFIVKPSIYDPKKKAAAFVVSLDKKAAPEPREADHDWKREQFIQERERIYLTELANKEVPELEKKHVIQMIDPEDPTDAKKLSGRSMAELMKTLWLQWLGNYEVAEKLEAVGIKCAAAVKAAAKEAAQMYDDAKTKKETLS